MDVLAELKPHLEILEKVETFEKKRELNRLLLFFAIAGFISIIGGWIEYVFYRLFDISSTFFIFGMTGQAELAPTAEPILFFSIWLIYLIPISGILIFTLGTPGIVNWNKSYRIIGATAIVLFIVAHITILFFGTSNSKLISGVWGTAICVGLLFTSQILAKEIDNKSIRLGLIAFSLIVFALGLITVIMIPEEESMLFFGSVFGILLTISGMTTYIKVGKANIPMEEGT